MTLQAIIDSGIAQLGVSDKAVPRGLIQYPAPVDGSVVARDGTQVQLSPPEGHPAPSFSAADLFGGDTNRAGSFGTESQGVGSHAGSSVFSAPGAASILSASSVH
jgi:hypothetical protein